MPREIAAPPPMRAETPRRRRAPSRTRSRGTSPRPVNRRSPRASGPGARCRTRARTPREPRPRRTASTATQTGAVSRLLALLPRPARRAIPGLGQQPRGEVEAFLQLRELGGLLRQGALGVVHALLEIDDLGSRSATSPDDTGDGPHDHYEGDRGDCQRPHENGFTHVLATRLHRSPGFFTSFATTYG